MGAGLLALAAGGAPAAAAAAGAAAPVNPLFANARIDGRFLLAGRVTTANIVPGEHKGETVSRTWTIASACAIGPCSTVNLTRPRQTGTDRLVLTLTGPGAYQGSGSFYAPLRCAGRLYRRGALVPFSVTVTVSAAVAIGAGVYATRLDATYSNRLRINRTPCVASLGNDAATYHGHLLLPGTAARARLSGRSPVGS
jgi:hypothetical protein